MYYAAWKTERLGAVPMDFQTEVGWLAILAERADLIRGARAGAAGRCGPPPPDRCHVAREHVACEHVGSPRVVVDAEGRVVKVE